MTLETILKPFIPEYIPAIGEVDAFLKVPRPDGIEETIGLTKLDEPTLNPQDPTVLEFKYIQAQQKPIAQAMEVHTIQGTDNESQVNNWITNVMELRKGQHAPTVSYTKNMPDIEHLMQVIIIYIYIYII